MSSICESCVGFLQNIDFFIYCDTMFSMVHTKEAANKKGIISDLFDPFVGVLRERPLVACVSWLGVFAVLLSLSFVLGIVPTIETGSEALAADTAKGEDVPPVVVNAGDSRPTRIVIDAIDLDGSITTPADADIETLDNALLSGIVHYPGSSDLADPGNVFLFGHSTGFRVVQNEAFKAFNDLKHLKENDLVRVQSSSREYVYRVTSVSLVSASDAFVDLSRSGRTLTLATCNVFGAKEERYVVKAEFVGDYALR